MTLSVQPPATEIVPGRDQGSGDRAGRPQTQEKNLEVDPIGVSPLGVRDEKKNTNDGNCQQVKPDRQPCGEKRPLRDKSGVVIHVSSCPQEASSIYSSTRYQVLSDPASFLFTKNHFPDRCQVTDRRKNFYYS
jgi:hypothetical protein